jgi:hypothetical protein
MAIRNVWGAAVVGLWLAVGCGGSPAGDVGDPDGGGGGDAGGLGDAGNQADTGMPPPGCTPRTCEELGKDCGPVADGCGGFVECGECTAPQTCGGGGVHSVCGGAQGCVPTTCEAEGKTCGHLADGCGSTVHCGECDEPGETCGGGGAHNVCGAPVGDPDACPALRTCEDAQAECGLISNGCGGTRDCGGCDEAGETCGGGGTPNRCGAASCTPRTCEQANPDGQTCGAIPDGCGGLVDDCGRTCDGGESCGGGGVPGVCGTSDSPCVPMTTEATCWPGDCGPRSDGCGGVVQCGGCGEGTTCGGGSTPGVCGAPPCMPRTCEDFGANCGTVPTGCGDATVPCGDCPTGEICGGEGEPNRCGDPGSLCEPLGCAEQGVDCGMAGDGCGGLIDCEGCPAGQSCGGGGVRYQCGAPDCQRSTCDAHPEVECGPVADGCGGLTASCGTCTLPDICGGGGEPSVCGGGGGQGGTDCTGLCEHQVHCGGGGATTVVGKVYAPNSVEPLFNAVVYVPNAPLPDITDGVSCDRCEDEDLGQPLVAAISAPDGSFELRHVPAGVPFPLVIKMGKWRRVVTIPAVEACTTQALTPAQSRLPRNRAEGHIPRIAVSTGQVDALECVLRKAGIDEAEFTRPEGNGRVHLYRANGAHAPGSTAACDAECGACTSHCGSVACFFGTCSAYNACRSACLSNAPRLYADQGTLDSYDVVMFGCEASAQDRPAAARARLLEYVDKGGRLFLSHWSMDWIVRPSYSTVPLSDTADWSGPFTGGLSETGQEAFVETSFARGQSFSDWLGHVGASVSPGVVRIEEARAHVVSTTEHGRTWIHTTQQDHARQSVQYLTFNTPVGASEEAMCGRGVYTAFHVATGSHGSATFPNHCGGPLTPQEKVLLFMMFDLAACVSDDGQEPPPPPTCAPRTCDDTGATCGWVTDGCGGSDHCGTCPPGQFCVGGACLSECEPRSCEDASADCGYLADGCGSTLFCGDCTWPEACGALTPNQCGFPQCAPRTCDDMGAECGWIGDGCGDAVHCGTCPPETTCGGGGSPNRCGAGSCLPTGCDGAGAECGYIGDGCGGQTHCGNCPDGQFCGGDGEANRCGGDPCPPLTCADVGAGCGLIGDGCGGTRDCGSCPEPTICGGGGVAHQCGGGCAPLTCNDLGAQCGWIGDGCGDAVHCGDCPPGTTCGADGHPNQCGPGPGCAPQSCETVGAECGWIGDGCGDALHCGDCPGHTLCGGGGVPNVCGGGCPPLTCEEQGVECGQASDGCGNLLECGTCPSGHLCQTSSAGSRCTWVG